MLLSTALYWYSRNDYNNVRAEVGALQRSTPFPSPLNGFKLEFRGVSSARHSGERRSEDSIGARGPKLLIVASDTCGPCLKLVPKWKTVLSRGFKGEVLLIATGGNEIVDQLWAVLRDNQSAQVLHIDQAQEFQLATGIMTTPSMVLLDSEDRVRLLTNNVDDASMDALSPFLGPGD